MSLRIPPAAWKLDSELTKQSRIEKGKAPVAAFDFNFNCARCKKRKSFHKGVAFLMGSDGKKHRVCLECKEEVRAEAQAKRGMK